MSAFLLLAAVAAGVYWLMRVARVPLAGRAVAILFVLIAVENAPCFLAGKTRFPVDTLAHAEPWRGVLATPPPAGSSQRTDLAYQMLPWMAAVRGAFGQGTLPLWNRFDACGGPLLGAAQSAPFHPLHLIGLVLPLADAWNFAAVGALLLAALFAAAWLSEIGLAWPATVLGAVIFSHGGFLLAWDGYPLVLVASAVPLLFAGIHRCFADPSTGAALLAASGGVLVALGGNPELAAFVALVAAAYAGFEAWRGRRAAGAAALSIGATLALTLSAVLLFPFLATLSQSAEFALRGSQERHGIAFGLARTRLPGALVAGYAGDPARGTFWGAGDYATVTGPYAGVIAIALAMAALAVARRRRPEVLFGLALAALSLIVGYDLAGAGRLLLQIPPFGFAILPRIFFAAPLGVALAAAAGADEILAEGQGAIEKWGRALAVAGAAVVLASIGLVAAMPEAGVASLARGGGRLAALAPLLWLLILAAVLALARRRPGAHGAVLAVAVLACCCAAERAMEWAPEAPWTSASQIRPHSGAAAYLAGQPEPFRVVAPAYDVVPNTLAIYGLEDARGYETLRPGALAEVDPLWSTPQFAWFNRVDDLASPWLAFLNVRYFWLDPSRPVPPGHPLLYSGPDGKILGNPKALPRYFVPDTVLWTEGHGVQNLRAVASIRDFSALAILSPLTEPEKTRGLRGATAHARIEVLHHGENGDFLRVRASGPTWIVTSLSYVRGLSARRAGRELPLSVANHAFLAFRVPSGESRVEILYAPASLRAGAIVSLLGLLGCGALAAAAAKKRQSRGVRRSREADQAIH
jgi:Bacterial membrane protein YfhO